MIIFVVIGVVAVLAVVVYAGAFLYEALTGAGATRIGGTSRRDRTAHGFGNSGILSGLKFSSGFKNEEVKVGPRS